MADDDDDEGPSIRFQTTLSVEMTNWLQALANARVFGRTSPAVGRALIEAGIRQAINDGVISKEDGFKEHPKTPPKKMPPKSD
jgi:hypothetical protein